MVSYTYIYNRAALDQQVAMMGAPTPRLALPCNERRRNGTKYSGYNHVERSMPAIISSIHANEKE